MPTARAGRAAPGEDDDMRTWNAGSSSWENRAMVAGWLALALGGVLGGIAIGCSDDEDGDNPDASQNPSVESAVANLFVTSDTSPTGDLGGLVGADARCERLAQGAALVGKSWRAYLSVESDADNGGMPTHARDRIGSGPWYNVQGEEVAADLAELLQRNGDAALFLDEHGNKIAGQWEGSPKPVEHDILTGTGLDGTVAVGKTCEDWTSASAELVAMVGHSDGLGPMMNPNPPYASWHSSHESMGCNDTAPRGGAGRLYCFGVE
jgi:hypothetical protein